MFMGFLSYSDVPPGGAPSSGDVPDEGDDTARLRREAAESIRARYHIKTSRAGKYAWLISLSIHCAILVGGFFAVRSYFHQTSRSEPTADIQRRGSGLYVVTSADATDAVHSFWSGPAILHGGDSSFHDPLRAEQVFPGFNLDSHQTLASLQDHSPAIGRANADPGSLRPAMGRAR
jgi:hypothetical protein